MSTCCTLVLHPAVSRRSDRQRGQVGEPGRAKCAAVGRHFPGLVVPFSGRDESVPAMQLVAEDERDSACLTAAWWWPTSRNAARRGGREGPVGAPRPTAPVEPAMQLVAEDERGPAREIYRPWFAGTTRVASGSAASSLDAVELSRNERHPPADQGASSP